MQIWMLYCKALPAAMQILHFERLVQCKLPPAAMQILDSHMAIANDVIKVVQRTLQVQATLFIFLLKVPVVSKDRRHIGQIKRCRFAEI